MTDPWERLDRETPASWEAFTTYRNMGAERSTAKVARTLGKSKALTDRWSSANKWVERAQAWDDEQDRQWRAETARARRKMAERQAKLGALGENKVASWLMNLDPDTLTPSEAARWLEVASRLQHSALGEPGQVDHSDAVTFQIQWARPGTAPRVPPVHVDSTDTNTPPVDSHPSSDGDT